MTYCDLCFEKQVAVSFNINIILHIPVGAMKLTLFNSIFYLYFPYLFEDLRVVKRRLFYVL